MWLAGRPFTYASLRARSGEAFQKRGFSFIEVISPCPTPYQRRNQMGDGVLYPYVTQRDIMVFMPQEAYNRFAHELAPGGTCIMEEDLVRVSNLSRDKKVFAIPATRFAEELGKRMLVNSVMVGFFSSVAKLLSADAVRKAIADSVPSSFRELNLKAFEKGYEYGLNAKAGAPPELEEVGYAQE